MFVTMKEMFNAARKSGHAVGAFHAINLEQVQGILEASVEEQVPVIVCLNEQTTMYAGMRAFMAMVKALAEDVQTPVTLLLDHIHDLDIIQNALQHGFSGILAEIRAEEEPKAFDFLKAAKDLCDQSNALFEISLRLREENHALNIRSAPNIINQVDPHSICISINKAERAKPVGDTLELIAKIIPSLGCPASLAGVGRWKDDEIKRSIKAGAWKISIGTRLNMAFTNGLKSYLAAEPDRINPRSYLAAAKERFRREVRDCIHLLQSVQ
jgi:tagatose 1,6-diphosphate aldolase GatY/KbaY